MQSVLSSKITKNISIGFFCFFIALLFVSLGSYSTSPFLPIKDYGDSVIFQTIGKGWSQGLVPYSQLWDLKGPYIFFVNALGYFLTGDRTGLFIIQIVNLFITIIIIFKLFRIRFSTPVSLLLLVVVLGSYFYTYSAGNSTEEICLPFLFLSVYFQFKWLSTINKEKQHRPIWALIYGIAFSICFLTRITNFIGIGIGVVLIAIYLMIQRKIRNLLNNIFLFFLGFVVVSLPFIVYFALNNAFYDFLYGTIFYNIGYANSFGFQFRPINLPQASSLLGGYGTVIIFTIMFIKRKETYYKQYCMFWLLCSLTCYLWLLKCADFRHYCTILLPYIGVSLMEITALVRPHKKSWIKIITLIPLIVLICLALIGVPKTAYNCLTTYNNEIKNNQQESNKSNKEALNLIQQIPEEDKDSFIAFNCNSGIYLQSNINPCYRFFALQSFEIEQNNSIETLIIEEFEKCTAKWILINGQAPEWLNKLCTLYYTQYNNDNKQSNSSYVLYKK